MHVFMTPKEAAPVLRTTEASIRKRIREGVITNIVTNGHVGTGARYVIDMTREFGIEEVPVR